MSKKTRYPQNDGLEKELPPSRAQLKRDMAGLRKMAAQLVELSANQIERIPYREIQDAIGEAKKITKGNAKKRQLQYIAKQLNKLDLSPITEMIDLLNASSVAYVQRFHQLEVWREELIAENLSVMEEICKQHPSTDRQHLRQIAKNATAERKKGEQQTQFRKLFQYLKEVASDEN